jgi:hypothetical protein
MKSDLLNDSLWLANPSMFLALVGVAVLLCFEEDRWVLGCALLVASLLVKPLLLGLLVIPVLRGRWRALLVTVIPSLVLLGLSFVFVPGASRLTDVISFVLRGSTLEGRLGIYYNLSLQGLGARLGETGPFTALRILVAVVSGLTAVVWWRRSDRPGSRAAVAVVLTAGVLLVGNLSESHYVVILVSCTLLALVLRREWLALWLGAPAFLIMFLPRYYLGGTLTTPAQTQVRYIAVEVLLWSLAVWMVWRPPMARPVVSDGRTPRSEPARLGHGQLRTDEEHGF